MGKAYLVSFIIAVIIGVAGGTFEVFVLWQVFGFVTFTLGPVFLFFCANLVFLCRLETQQQKEGANLGFLNVFFVAIISFLVFWFQSHRAG